MLNIVDWTSWTIVIAESIARPMSYIVKELRLVDYIYQIGDDRTRVRYSSSSTCVALYCVFEKEREKKKKKKTEFIGEKNRHRRYDRSKETLRRLSNL